MTVIVPRSNKSNSRVFHTDICRVVWQIQDKQYWDREMAEAWEYEECPYCAGEFEDQYGTGRRTRRELLQEDTKVRPR